MFGFYETSFSKVIEWRHRRWRCIEMTFKKIAFRFRGYSVQKPTGLLVFSKHHFAIFPIAAKSSLFFQGQVLAPLFHTFFHRQKKYAKKSSRLEK
ncbi:hypothetical protein [Gilvibacter sp.]|uniref:hypothetical protein n=1 Tax=Gilvibacter sp. TaxID=2729997 RepID=UPI003F49BB11